MEIIIGLLFIGLVFWFFKALLGIKTVPAPTVSAPRIAAAPRKPAKARGSTSPRAVIEPVSGLTFSITISGDERAAKIRQDVTSENRWLPSNREVTIAGRKISGGLLYVGDGLASITGYRLEPALIDPSLPVAKSVPSGFRRTMGYWPSYDSISAEDRAVYLDWLAAGRRNPQTDIGYVFLFFYGLERRALADAPRSDRAKADLAAIRQEVVELLRLYGNNNSFNRYANQLIEAIDTSTEGSSMEPTDAQRGYGVSMSTQVAIGRLIAAGEPLSADWALSWLLTHPETSVRTSMQRCRSEFETVFRSRYEKQFGKGLVIKPNKSKLQVSIRPASASFGGTLTTSLDLPDINKLSAPIEKLRQLGEQCASDLDAFSRWVGRNPGAQKTVAALALLPSELSASQDNSEARDLWNWLAQTLGPHDRAIANADDLLEHCKSFGSGKLAKSEAVVLAQLLGKGGFGIEPDVRFGGAPIAPNGKVVIFKSAADEMSIASPQYAAAITLLHLAVAVASADGSISEIEEERLAEHVRNGLGLNDSERNRLAAHLEWLKASNVATTGLKKRLAGLDARQKTSIADFVIGVAGADGHVSAEEIKTLGKIYPMLGLEADAVYGHVHAMTAGDTSPATVDEPVTVLQGDKRASFAIPHSAQRPSGVRLDMSVVQAKLADSAKLAVILQDVFTETDAPPPTPVSEAPVSTRLPHAYIPLLAKLAEQSEWSRGEFETTAEVFGLMPDAALDAMNEAAFEHLGAPILEGDDPIEVDLAAAKELLA